jgi:hypothetical protein
MRRLLHFLIISLLSLASVIAAPAADAPATDASAAQDAEIKRWFPRTHAKLLRRSEPVRVLVLGDRVANFTQPSPAESSNIELSWHWRLLEHLAGRYYFTGGVRLTEAGKSKRKSVTEAAQVLLQDDSEDGPQEAEPLNFDTSGAPILVENDTRNSVTASEAITALTTDALDREPDLVILNYGITDLVQGVSPLAYGEALSTAVKLCQIRKIDVLVAGPALTMGDVELRSLGATRPYASVAEEVAAAAKVCFLDLGALQLSREVDPKAPRSTQGYDLVVRELRRQYIHPRVKDFLTPNADAHRIMAEAAWAQLSQSPTPDPISVQASLTLPTQEAAPAMLQLAFKSARGGHTGIQEIAIGALGLDRNWTPKTTLTEAEATAKQSPASAASNVVNGWNLTIPCAFTPVLGVKMMSRPDLAICEESFARSSLIISEGSTARLINFRAPIVPIQATFPLGCIEGLTNEIPLKVTIHNSSNEAFTGQAEVVWRGHTETFPVTFPAGKPVPVTLKLPLPPEVKTVFKSQVTLRIKQGNKHYDFAKELEVAPDLSLDQRVALVNRTTHIADAPPPKTDGLSVNLNCKADSSGIYFIFDLPTVDQNRKRNQPSAKIEVTIDARKPGERGGIGWCEHISLEVPWVDGRFSVEKIPFGVFGPGYDRALDPNLFIATVSTQRDDRRQVRLSIPRAYFYLHEWDLKGRKQSTLGFNAQVQLLQFPDDNSPGVFSLEQSFSLVSPGLPRNDAQALGVLNLATPAPANWSVRIY